MKLHAIQTGSVRIKTAQVDGRGRGLRRRLAVITDRNWTQWLPTYAWVIEHPEGVIVVDTGQGTHLLETATPLHPYARWGVAFRIERDQEIGPQLRARGIGPRDVTGHTRDHVSVVVEDQGTTFFLAGDTSYDERLMLAGRVDGVSADDDVAGATLRAIRQLARNCTMVYLPTHDPESSARLASRTLVDHDDGTRADPVSSNRSRFTCHT